MILPIYAYIDLPGATYILHLKPPFVIGRLYCYTEEKDFNHLITSVYPAKYAQLDGYNIAVVEYGRLPGDDKLNETEKVINGMLTFFSEGKLIKSKKFYEKFSRFI